MPTALQFRRGTTSQNNSFTGVVGELTVDTDLDTIVVHDGSTAGGFQLTQNDAVQTLTNKTLTNPTINGGTFSGTFTGAISPGQVTTNSIVSNGSNADISIQPSGTGDVLLSALRVNGTTLDSSDSTKITVAEALDVTGALVAATSLNIAGDGATVTGIKDEDDMSSNSATKLATQQSIKAFVESGTSTLTNKTLTSPTINSPTIDSPSITNTTIVGTATIGAVTTNAITSNGSNADLSIQPSGTGDVLISALRVNGTTLDSSDSTKITIAEALDVTGALVYNGFTMPTTDGSDGQAIVTDGSKTLSFATVVFFAPSWPAIFLPGKTLPGQVPCTIEPGAR